MTGIAAFFLLVAALVFQNVMSETQAPGDNRGLMSVAPKRIGLCILFLGLGVGLLLTK